MISLEYRVSSGKLQLPQDSFLSVHAKKLTFAEGVIFLLGMLLLTAGVLCYTEIIPLQQGLSLTAAGAATLGVFLLIELAGYCYCPKDYHYADL